MLEVRHCLVREVVVPRYRILRAAGEKQQISAETNREDATHDVAEGVLEARRRQVAGPSRHTVTSCEPQAGGFESVTHDVAEGVLEAQRRQVAEAVAPHLQVLQAGGV